MKCLVTGGAGFIGSHLVDRLLALGHEVIIIDDLSSGKKDNLAHQKDNPHLQVFSRNICDAETDHLFEGVSVTFHLAAIPRVQYSIAFPEKTNEVNIQGTLRVLEASRKAGVKRLIYSASSSAYGDQEQLPLIEYMNPNPLSPYALQKLVGEYYCRLYYHLHGMETISLRYFNVYGPRQDPSGGYACLIPKSLQRVANDEHPEIYGDGEQTRDFTYVKDVIEANILAATTKNSKAFGEIFNIGQSQSLSVNQVVKNIIGTKNLTPKYQPPVIEPRHTLADINKAKMLLGWTPQYTFEEGIRETKMWFSNGSQH